MNSLTASPPDVARRIAVVRAALAVLWAAALVILVGGEVLTTDTSLAAGAALVLTAYPGIDLIASLAEATRGDAASAGVLRLNAAVDVVAIAALAGTAFGADAGATLVAFGAWAAVSGVIQLSTAVRCRAAGGQLPMLVSGGLSTVAGLSFIASATGDEAHLVGLAGYMAFGAVLYVIWAVRDRRAAPGRVSRRRMGGWPRRRSTARDLGPRG